jgi:hypothetical protein
MYWNDNDNDHDNDHDNDNNKSFISFWIATGGQSPPRNDDQNHDNDK